MIIKSVSCIPSPSECTHKSTFNKNSIDANMVRTTAISPMAQSATVIVWKQPICPTFEQITCKCYNSTP